MGGKKFTKKQIEDAGIKTEDITSIKKSDNIVMVLYNSDNLTGERSVYYDNKNNFQTLSSGFELLLVFLFNFTYQ